MADARFWDRMAARYDASKRSPGFQRAIDDAIALLGPSDIVLDLGCGSGPVSREIAPYVMAVHGIDISPKMIELARPHEGPGLTFELATLEDPSLDARGFTVIVAFNVLHFVELEMALRRFRDLLPSGGHVIVLAACVRDIHPMIRAAVWITGKVARMPRMNRFSAAELEKRFTDAGFDIVASQTREEWSKVRWLVARRR